MSNSSIFCQNTFHWIAGSDIILNTFALFIPDNVACKSRVKSSIQLCIKKGCPLIEGGGGSYSRAGPADRDISTDTRFTHKGWFVEILTDADTLLHLQGQRHCGLFIIMPHITEVELTTNNLCVVCGIIACAFSWSTQIYHMIGINHSNSSCYIISKTAQNLSANRAARASIRFIHELPESNGWLIDIMSS